MFSSPAIRVFSQENTETAPKKPGATTTITRKPFVDRAVNATSPDPRALKSESRKKTPQAKLETHLEPPKLYNEDDDLFFYDSYSFKEFEDNYLDISFLCGKNSLNIHRSFYNNPKTPPPQLDDIDDLFIKMPELNSEHFDDQFLEESVDEVSLPQLELD